MDEKFLKITNAVYKVLEFFPEADPLKNKAKEKALSIMGNLTSLAGIDGWASFQNEKTKKQISEDIDVLLGYLWIAKSQAWMSAINYLIISNEYEKISVGLRHCEEHGDEAIQSVITNSGLPRSPNGLARNDEGELTPRQSRILDILDKTEKAQVMDLQKVLPNITKRTIRRDLEDLLKANKITRVGEFNQVFYKIVR